MKNRRSYNRFNDDEDINPMNYVSNLSDVMLVFAVGMMLALITHWNLDVKLNSKSEETSGTQIDTENARSFTEDERNKMRSDATEGGSTEGMQKTGEIYYDAASNTYYIVEGESAE